MSSYSYPPFDPNPVPAKQYPAAHSMSSAFSASANPNEDWTKISDLAERRRIQNRIAQRNYRKKLKKRLEDLERRAGSSSASPEQQPAELADIERPRQRSRASSSLETSSSPPMRQQLHRQDLSRQSFVPIDGRAMFTQQATRQLSTSPPPFSYNSIDGPYQYPQANSYCVPQPQPIYQQFMPPNEQSYPPAFSGFSGAPVKLEQYGDDAFSPFSNSYASISNLDMASMPQHSDMPPYTPSLLDSLDFVHPDSPPESLLCPTTPQSFGRTPPLYI